MENWGHTQEDIDRAEELEENESSADRTFNGGWVAHNFLHKSKALIESLDDSDLEHEAKKRNKDYLLPGELLDLITSLFSKVNNGSLAFLVDGLKVLPELETVAFEEYRVKSKIEKEAKDE